MGRRQLGDAGAQDRAGVVAVQRSFRRIGFVGDLKRVFLIDVLVLALAQRGQRLEAGDRQQPSGNLGTALELAGGAPHVEKHLADEVFRHRGVAHHAQYETVNPDVVTGVKHMHRRAAACRNALQKHFVRRRTGIGDVLAGCGVDGNHVRHDKLPIHAWRRFVGRIVS
jgi:hypothetical protein